MLRWLKRLLVGSDPPSVRRIMACEDAINALSARVDQRYDELKALRGKVARMKRDIPDESTPEPDQPVSSTPERAPVAPETAHLARRFKVF